MMRAEQRGQLIKFSKGTEKGQFPLHLDSCLLKGKKINFTKDLSKNSSKPLDRSLQPLG